MLSMVLFALLATDNFVVSSVVNCSFNWAVSKANKFFLSVTVSPQLTRVAVNKMKDNKLCFFMVERNILGKYNDLY